MMLLFPCICLLLPGSSTAAQTNRLKVGLVLSGGGARGAAHIGVLKVLEELRIPVDCIAGTSMGSIVGGLYATGLSADELEIIMRNIDWDDAFQDDPQRRKRPARVKEIERDFLVKASPGFREGGLRFPPGVVQGQKLNLILKELTLPVIAVNDFDNLSIPYRACATDIENGNAVVLASGDLANAMRASMSVPGVFAPIMINGKLLVDGGVANNLPVNIARDMGAEVLIVVDISSPLRPGSEMKSALDITAQLAGILTQRNTRAQIKTLGTNDVLISPDLGDISSSDFSASTSTKAITVGEEAARELLPRLQKLSLTKDAYAAYLAGRKQFSRTPVTIDSIRVVNNSALSDEAIRERIHAKLGEAFDPARLNEDISLIYGLDIFERVDYEIIEEDGKRELIVRADKKAWGPNYVRAGLKLSTDSTGASTYTIGFSYTRTELNQLGGEWRTAVEIGNTTGLFSEFYQPLDNLAHYFVTPYAGLKRQNVNLYVDGDLITQYRADSFKAGVKGGRNLGTWGRVSLGIEWATGTADVRIGDPSLQDYDFDSGEVFVQATFDTQDNIYFPRSGALAALQYSWDREELGSDNNLEKLQFTWLGSYSLGRNTVSLGLAGATVFNNEDVASANDLFQLGGLLRLSGYNQDELFGAHLGLARIVYARQIANIAGQSAYLGGSFEAGNVWQDSDDITFDSLIKAGSIFLGLDSYLGPIYFGGGLAEGGRAAGYFYLGIPY
jgi:NTE family protein